MRATLRAVAAMVLFLPLLILYLLWSMVVLTFKDRQSK